MIASQKSPAFTWWFARVARGRIADTFGAVRVANVSRALAALDEGSIIAVSNHTAWWDPLVILWLTNHVLRCDSYALMNAANLRRLPFFGLVGALGVDLTDPRDGALAMRHAVKLLGGARRAVWVFAQGDERPISLRPLGFLRGSAEISRVAKRPAVPFAFRYEFGPDERPTLFVAVGEVIPASRDVAALRDAHEAAVTALLDRLDADLAAHTLDAYEPVMSHAPGAFAQLAERCLAAMTRPFAKVPPRDA